MELAQAGGTDGEDSLKLIRQQLQDDFLSLKDMCQQIQERIENRRLQQRHIIPSLQSVVPNLVSSLDLSLQIISSFNGRPYSPTLNLNPVNSSDGTSFTPRAEAKPQSLSSKPPAADPTLQSLRSDGDKKPLDDDGAGADPLSVVRSTVAVCLLERVPFIAIHSAAVLRKLEVDPSAKQAEKAALLELGGEAGPISAVEMALRAIAEDNGGVELEDFGVGGKNRIMVLGIDRSRLMRELSESLQPVAEGNSMDGNVGYTQLAPASGMDVNVGVLGMGGGMPRSSKETWIGQADPHMPGLPPIFPAAGTPAQMIGPRGGPA